MDQPGVLLNVEPASPAADRIPTAVPLFAGYTRKDPGHAVRVESFAEYEAQFGKLPTNSQLNAKPLAHEAALHDTVMHYFDNGGGYGYVLSLGTYDSLPEESDDDARQAVADKIANWAWETSVVQASDATLLAVPDTVLLDQSADPRAQRQNTIKRWVQVWQILLQVAYAHRRFFALFDAPSDAGLTRACLDQLGKQVGDDAVRAHGAVYWPRLQTNYRRDVPNCLLNLSDDTLAWVIVPPSGSVAAAIGSTDRERGVWKAPANVALAYVIRPHYSDWREAAPLFNEESGLSANLIRGFVGRGVRIWGCRTLASAPTPPRYIQVRRTLSYIEANLTELARFTVFEPNNEPTWFALKSLARAWLHQCWLAGGLYGAAESEAFQLRLGLGESMTQQDVQAGRLILTVGLAMQYPAEFIELRLQFRSGDGAGPVELVATQQGALL